MKHFLSSAWAKTLIVALSIISIAGFASVFAQPAEAAAAPSCYNLAAPLFFYQDSHLSQTVAWTTFYKSWDGLASTMTSVSRYRASVPALQSFLEREGFTIAASEKAAPTIGVSTASAITAFQEKYASEILTPQGLTHGIGFVDLYTAKALNQRYGCVDKATVDLTEPNLKTARARGEIMQIKWKAAKIPNTTTLNIKYTNADGSGAVFIASSTVSNGAGAYAWTIPSTLASGTYKIQLSLDGSAKSDISAVPFEIRDSSLQVVTPAGGETYSAGQKVALSWRTSSTIPATAPVNIYLLKTQSGITSSSTIVAGIRNTGSYAWTVPDVFTGAASDATSTYAVQVVTSSIAASSNSFMITPTTAVTDINKTSPSCPYTFTQNLNLGSNNQDVIALQNFLKTHGFFVGNSNGLFGATTKAALIAYQGVAGLTADGSFGPVSRAKANVDCNISTTAPAVVKIATTTQTVIRGGNATVTWVPSGTIPAKATISAQIIVNGQVISSKAGIAVSAGIASVPVPATAQAGTYSLRLVATGVTLDSASVLLAENTLIVSPQTGAINASVAAEAFKGESFRINWTGTNVKADALVVVTIVPASGSSASVTGSSDFFKKGGLPLTISNTVADGQYKAVLSTYVDGQPVYSTSSEFALKTRVVTIPQVTYRTPVGGSSLVRGTTTAVTWTALNMPASATLDIQLTDSAGKLNAVLASNVAATLQTAQVTIPALTVAGDHWIKLIPKGVKLDGSSRTEDIVSVTYETTSVSTTLSTTTPIRLAPLVVSWTGSASIPAASPVSVTVTSASGAAVTGLAKQTVLFGAGKATYTIPSAIANGTYTVTVSVGGNTLPVTSTATFTVSTPVGSISVAPRGVQNLMITGVSRTGSSTGMTASFPITVTASGVAMSQLQSTDFSIMLISSSGTMIPASGVYLSSISPVGTIAPGKSVSLVVFAGIKPTDLPASGQYRAALVTVAATQGGTRASFPTDSALFTTPTVNFVK